jgi:hypothetical protein
VSIYCDKNKGHLCDSHSPKWISLAVRSQGQRQNTSSKRLTQPVFATGLFSHFIVFWEVSEKTHERTNAYQSKTLFSNCMLQTKVNGYDFTFITHKKAVEYIKRGKVLYMLVDRGFGFSIC